LCVLRASRYTTGGARNIKRKRQARQRLAITQKLIRAEQENILNCATIGEPQ